MHIIPLIKLCLPTLTIKWGSLRFLVLLIGRRRIIIVANSLLLSFGFFFETFLGVIMAQAGLEFYGFSTSASKVGKSGLCSFTQALEC